MVIACPSPERQGYSASGCKVVVLVVEDQPILRWLAVGHRRGRRLRVVEACDADAAIRILETRTDIRIIFTDVEMPGSMDGVKLAHAVRGRWPPIEIIVVSGWTNFKAQTSLSARDFSASPTSPRKSSRRCISWRLEAASSSNGREPGPRASAFRMSIILLMCCFLII